MSSNEKPTTRPTLGLGGLTINAMALIAPGAFLWLTFFIQSSYGAPMAAQGMWFGIFAALLLCLATAIAYAELSKLYPGAGSSYFFAEQAFLSKTKAYRFARIAKFMVGWASHLYYWVYPGIKVARPTHHEFRDSCESVRFCLTEKRLLGEEIRGTRSGVQLR